MSVKPPKLQKCWRQKNCLQHHAKILKPPNFFTVSLLHLQKEALAKFYLSTTFGLGFMTSSVAPTRSSTSHAYLITKIGNCNLKRQKKLAKDFWLHASQEGKVRVAKNHGKRFRRKLAAPFKWNRRLHRMRTDVSLRAQPVTSRVNETRCIQNYRQIGSR